MTHEERALQVMGLRYEDGKMTDGKPHRTGLSLDAFVTAIAAAFAEVEAETRLECTPLPSRTMEELEAYLAEGPVMNMAIVQAVPGEDREAVIPPAPPAFCQECGKKPCETFMRCAQKQCNRIDARLQEKLAALYPTPRLSLAPPSPPPEPGACRVCGLASCMHPRNDAAHGE